MELIIHLRNLLLLLPVLVMVAAVHSGSVVPGSGCVVVNALRRVMSPLEYARGIMSCSVGKTGAIPPGFVL
jgi:hypothetical protein